VTRVCLGYPGHRCGRLVERANRCEACQRALYRIRNATRDPIARRIYASNAWRRLAEQVVASAAGCFYCGRADVKLTADHVVSIRRDPSRALDPTNVVAADRSCQEKRKHDPGWWGAGSGRKSR
jgi:5-methylcytosine-specific restriction endonuclease McrA